MAAAPVRIGVGFAFSNLKRALHEAVAHREFGPAEQQAVIEFFGGPPPRCVYCGCDLDEAWRWDHLFPIRGGGDTVLGNMVPACPRCDDSKQALTAEQWFDSGRRYSPPELGIPDHKQRLQRLREYAARFAYAPRSLESRLVPEEIMRLERLYQSAESLRKEIEELVEMYRRRMRDTGEE